MLLSNKELIETLTLLIKKCDLLTNQQLLPNMNYHVDEHSSPFDMLDLSGPPTQYFMITFNLFLIK